MEGGLEQLEQRISSFELTLAGKLDRLRKDVVAGRAIAEETRDSIEQLRQELADTLNVRRRRSRTAA
jgi:hypothetical protein